MSKEDTFPSFLGFRSLSISELPIFVEGFAQIQRDEYEASFRSGSPGYSQYGGQKSEAYFGYLVH